MKLIVVGAGIAGLVTALCARARGHEVELLVKGTLGDGCTALAQGGIAGSYGQGDSAALHALDTMLAGSGHGNKVAIAALADGASAAIRMLIDAGTPFDRTHDGDLARGLEAAHTLPRIAHAGGDATGAAISQALIERLCASSVRVREGAFAVDLLIEAGRARGIRSLDGVEREADAVVLATGGAGLLYPHTTNPAGTTGDGIALARRAGARVADLEFMQFHPTVLADAEPFLISEAVRGAGAVLRDADGHRFLLDEHPDAELAPRDVVARAVARKAQEQGAPVLLDATALGASALAQRFPTIDAQLRRRGADWSSAPVPITPAAHYLMGGIATDIDGRTSLPGLWAVGETACTGVHGANRLASNSLLEGAVFGARAAAALAAPAPDPLSSRSDTLSSTADPLASRSDTLSGCHSGTDCDPSGASPGDTGADRDLSADAWAFSRAALQRLMWERVGLLRDDAGLEHAVRALDDWQTTKPRNAVEQEDANLLLVAREVASAALARTDSLGAHHRTPALIGAA